MSEASGTADETTSTAPVAKGDATNQATNDAASETTNESTNESTNASTSDDMRGKVLEALKVVRDPEIPVNVVDLGLVYDVQIDDKGQVGIEMTLTSMGCPVQDLIQTDAELAVMKVDGVNAVTVEFVWSPPWSPQKMTEDGKKQMRMFGFNL